MQLAGLSDWAVFVRKQLVMYNKAEKNIAELLQTTVTVAAPFLLPVEMQLIFNFA